MARPAARPAARTGRGRRAGRAPGPRLALPRRRLALLEVRLAPPQARPRGGQAQTQEADDAEEGGRDPPGPARRGAQDRPDRHRTGPDVATGAGGAGAGPGGSRGQEPRHSAATSEGSRVAAGSARVSARRGPPRLLPGRGCVGAGGAPLAAGAGAALSPAGALRLELAGRRPLARWVSGALVAAVALPARPGRWRPRQQRTDPGRPTRVRGASRTPALRRSPCTRGRPPEADRIWAPRLEGSPAVGGGSAAGAPEPGPVHLADTKERQGPLALHHHRP
jgi:hypothetical protein